MAVLFYIKRRVVRNIKIGASLALVLGCLGWFQCLFLGHIDKKHMEIENAYDDLPVKVTVSNLQGTQTDHLAIPEHIIDYFISEHYSYIGSEESEVFSSYVTDVLIKSTLYYTINISDHAENVQDGKKPENQQLVGITSTLAEPKLDPTEGITIDFFQGHGELSFTKEEPVCIISNEFLCSLKKDMDNKYRIPLKVQVTPDANTMKKITVEVIGTYSGEGNVIYCSWNTVAGLQELLSGKITADSLSATLKDNHTIF